VRRVSGEALSVFRVTLGVDKCQPMAKRAVPSARIVAQLEASSKPGHGRVT